MPLLNDLSLPSDWIEPDEVPRPVVAYGFETDGVGGIELDLHHHAKGQIMLVQRGAISCEVEGGLWIVPPGSALWIPGGALHTVNATGLLEGYNAFVDPAVCVDLPRSCCAVSVTPLLREVLARAASLPLLYEEGGANSHLVALLLHELAAARVEDLHLPMPTDARLRKIAHEVLALPADRATLDVWAKRAGMSERTLARVITRQTGMSFGRWRQQLCVVLAVKWLADGASIQQVAADLGYESAPSFVTMFRKVLGISPGRYMAERHSAQPRKSPPRGSA